ncbi:GumC family protein [Longimicrobium sp.]|uniref:GumC family protein n=1 Tax=Longimicrobium sp. TaxID=2029185 RepID=UPI002CB4437F|nr:polysaccharide biosynthesis tyrosine autokinase [Longimicrobium sp.]HSU17079.1 polysaccharide biosynthesis tyrosine autokinase [Longimicrobium sp.]
MPNVNRPGSDAGKELDLRDLTHMLFGNRWVILSVTAIVLALAGVFTWMQHPVYESGTTLRIDDKDASRNPLQEYQQAMGMRKGVIETETVVLQSRTMAEAVADSLALHVELVKPHVARGNVLRVLRAPRDARPNQYRLSLRPNRTYAVTSEAPVAGLPTAVRLDGAPFLLGDLRLAFSPSLLRNPPEQVVVRVRSFRAAVDGVRRQLTVQRVNPDADVLAIRYTSGDQELVAEVPNALTSTFIRYKNAGAKTEARSTVEFLRTQVQQKSGELRDAEVRLQSFREQAQVVNPGEEASSQVKRLADLQAQRDQLVGERDALSQLLARVQSAGRSPTDHSPYRQLASFPVFLSNPAFQDMLRTITQLENDRSTAMVRRTETDPDVEAITQRIHALELQLYTTATNYLQSLNSQINSIQANLARFGGQLQTIPAREVEYARLQRQQTLLEQLSSLLQTRLKEAEIQQAVEPGNVQVIDAALRPQAPISPNPVRNLTLASVFGLMLGIALVLGRQALDTKIRTPEDAATVTEAPVLGTIPRIVLQTERNGKGAYAAAGNGNGNGNGNGKNGHGKGAIVPASPGDFLDTRLITQRDPRSPAAEAYRALRTSLTFSSTDKPPQVVVVSSALPGDGKSTSASNLAVTLAQQGTRTLVVDGDLRRGLLHTIFGLKQEPGLTHVLLERATLDEAIREVPINGTEHVLHVLPAGVFPPNPSEMLGSERMRNLLLTLRERYEMVIFDAPPLNLVTDAAVLGTLADSTVLIARAGSTDKGALHHAAAQLHHLRAPLGGIVLNDFRVSAGRYYGGYGYGYYGYGVYGYSPRE